MFKGIIYFKHLTFLQQTFEQSGVGMMSSGSGYGYNQAQFSSGHSTQRAVMMRQKSMGQFRCKY